MRQYGPSSTRSGFQDRNPVRFGRTLNQALAGGGNITSTSYTVPTARRAIIWHWYLSYVIVTAPAAGQIATVDNELGLGAAVGPIGLRLESFDPNPRATEHFISGGEIELTQGDVQQFHAVNAAGAGAYNVHCFCSILEYDA